MITVIDVLESLESNGSRLAKEQILNTHRDNDLLRRVFVAALDPYTNYYVTKFKMPPAQTGAGADDAVVTNFLDMIEGQLATRRVTGNAAKQIVTNAFQTMDARQQKWCKRILLRNLRCGVSDTTVNKTRPGAVRKFSVQLAVAVTTAELRGLVYPLQVEPKLDGLRCVAVKSGGVVSMFTRNGTLLETLPTIRAALEAHPSDNVVLDGEAMGADWNESVSVAMSRKRAKDDSGMVYHVFDIVPLAVWRARDVSAPLADRRSMLEEFGNQVPDGTQCIRLTPKIIAGSAEEVLSFYGQCTSGGHEGVMVKRLSAPYAWRRNDSVLKLKPFHTYKGTIVGWHLGSERGCRANEFGGFDVLLPNGVVTAAGSGLNDAMRAEVAAVGPDAFIGRIVECEAQELTADGKMRHPVVLRCRNPSDVDPLVLEAYAKWKSLR